MGKRLSVVLVAAVAASATVAGTGCREGVLDTVNHAPVIQSVVATPPNVLASQEIVLRAEATDEDGDGIRYFWASEAGAFDVAAGETVRWTAPTTAGDYWIKVNASDRVASTGAELRVRVQGPTPRSR